MPDDLASDVPAIGWRGTVSSYDTADLIDDVVVVVLGGGQGERLGGSRPKAFVGVAGEVMIAHSIRTFEQHDAVDSIVLVVPEDWIGPTEALVDDLGCDRVAAIVAGGSSRAASVVAALECIPRRRETAVLVHDSARPLVDAALIDRVLAPLAAGCDGVVPVVPMTDTVKQLAEGDLGVVEATLDRSRLGRAQTPQACRSSALHAALMDLEPGELAGITDCTQAVAADGGACVAVPGSERALKITTSADLQMVERMLGFVAGSDGGNADDAVGSSGSQQEDPEDLEPLDEDDLAGFDEVEAP